MRIKLLFSLLLLVVAITPLSSVFAGEFTVRPFLIDVDVLARDLVSKTVTLTNVHEFRKYVVYATVNEISVDNDGAIKEFVTPVMTDRTNTVTSWIEVTRGRIEISPGGQEEVPLTLRINPFAEPGEYHVFVGFVPAPNRPKAQEIAMNGDADGVVVKITVADKRVNSMKISAFLVDRFITDDDGRIIEVEVENKGDLPSVPTGEIIFYDSRGVEVTSVDVNSDKKLVEPGESMVLKSIVPLEDKLGRYKANVSLQYGKNQSASLHDTTSFYMMPLHLLLIVFGVILVLAFLTTMLFKRTFLNRNYDYQDGEEVSMYVRDGHDAVPQDHDIDLKNKS